MMPGRKQRREATWRSGGQAQQSACGVREKIVVQGQRLCKQTHKYKKPRNVIGRKIEAHTNQYAQR